MKLAKVLTYQKGRSPQNQASVTNRQVLYLTPEYLRGNSQPSHIPDFPSKVEVSDGDILLLWDGSNAGEFFRGKDGALASTMVKFDFDENKLDSRFLYYQLKGFESYLKAQTNGSGIPHVDREILFSLEAQCFDSGEQKKIAEILSTADEAIERTQALIDKYSRIKRGLMQDLLTRGIDENGNIRNKQTHKFTTKTGIEVPDEWDVGIIENFANLHNRLRKPISAIDRFEKQGIYPYYGATGIIDYIDEYRLDGKFVLFGEDGDHFLKFETQEMTHLVNGKFNVSNHAHILSGKELCSTEWLHYYFSHRDITYYLTRQGAGRFKLNKTDLLRLPVFIPPPQEQERIILVVETFAKNYFHEKQTLAKLRLIRAGLMQDLLSGRKRVNMDA